MDQAASLEVKGLEESMATSQVTRQKTVLRTKRSSEDDRLQHDGQERTTPWERKSSSSRPAPLHVSACVRRAFVTSSAFVIRYTGHSLLLHVASLGHMGSAGEPTSTPSDAALSNSAAYQVIDAQGIYSKTNLCLHFSPAEKDLLQLLVLQSIFFPKM